MVNQKTIERYLVQQSKKQKASISLKTINNKFKSMGEGSFLIGEFVLTVKKEKYKSFDFQKLLKTFPEMKKFYTKKQRTKISIM